jgi:hypothetical protein
VIDEDKVIKIVTDYIKKTYPEVKNVTEDDVEVDFKYNIVCNAQYTLTCSLLEHVYFELIYHAYAYRCYLYVYERQDFVSIDPEPYGI